ncbi:hypothetical protein ACERIT_10625 [Halopenitus sp. H-Gu1]|uniref:hypothetical protein n=1 Tax=Halopenitus sp. H-Gu1 TaxID=3242697 RepID=UPI00359DAE1D
MGGSRTRVAIVGEESALEATALETAVSEAGATTCQEPVRVDVVLAVGERGLLMAARESLEAPIIAVDAGWAGDSDVPDGHDESRVTGFPDGGLRYAIDVGRVPDVLDRFDGDGSPIETVDHPLLAVSVGGVEVATALFDVTLVTSEPARISEYAVESGAEYRQSFRADAVTVATPIGTTGYARCAGAPVLSPGTGLVVVPVAPFSTRTDTWVVNDSATISVEREEEPVSLVIDDEVCRTVGTDDPVSVSVDGRLRIVSSDLERGSADPSS